MNAPTIILASDKQRQLAHRLIDAAPMGAVVTVKEATRTLDQNARLFAMLTDIARAKPMGRRHTVEDWKQLAMHACGWECQFVEGLDGRPFPMGFRSSRLTKSQMSMLIEWLFAFGAEHGVQWSDPNPYS